MSHPSPTELNLHKGSKVLEVTFDDGFALIHLLL